MRTACVLVLFLGLTACPKAPSPAADAGAAASRPSAPRLLDVGPRAVSNQTASWVWVTGEALRPGLALELDGEPVTLEVLDEAHALARIPAGLAVPPSASGEGTKTLRLAGGDAGLRLQVVDDVGFVTPAGLAGLPSGNEVFTTSQGEDAVLGLDLRDGGVRRLPVADGPVALAVWPSDAGAQLVVAHRFSPELRVLPLDGGQGRAVVAPASASALVVHQGVAYLAEQARDSVSAIDLASGKERWRTPVAPNPGALAVAGDALLVGSMQTGELEQLSLADGLVHGSAEPGPGTPIFGGGTAAFSAQVMNGSGVRAIAVAPKAGRALLATIGPNVGPNALRMEVSMNGGVTVAGLSPLEVKHHLGFGAGVTQALAVDEAKGLVFAADVSLGLVRVLDLKKLLSADPSQALLQELAVPPPADFPRIRPESDLGVKGRAGVSLHSGPAALWLAGERLVVLDRFTGTVAVVDVRGATKKKAALVTQWPLAKMLTQPTRRLGEVLYFADLGRTAMSCDACHPAGHTGGLMFEKTQPLRLYRVPTVRGTRDNPPYFTPASTRSLAETAKVVGGRNRFHNPDPTEEEIDALTTYSAGVLTLPNPFLSEGLPQALTLPNGQEGHPRAGAALFGGKAQCGECHPWPGFTTDARGETRGQFIDVGTPHLFPLREKQQDPHFSGFAPPSLLGAWDVFPMLTTGLAGLSVREDGAVKVSDRFPLARAVMAYAPKHGRADGLTAQEQADLLAFVMCL